MYYIINYVKYIIIIILKYLNWFTYMSILQMKDLNLYNKRVLIRLDLNVPIKNGKIISDKRILSSLSTIEQALNKGAKLILASHLGRPKEGVFNKNYSLLPIVNYLKKYFNIPVKLCLNYLNNGIIFNNNKEIIVLENVRFNIGEIKNNKFLSKKYAKLCDIFVMDAFATAHRKNSSTYGIVKYAPISCIGPLFDSEIRALTKIMLNPARPMVAILGGAKISTKFNILNFFSKKADHVIIGGGISNTFIAINNNIGNSLYEPKFVKYAKKLSLKSNILIPVDCRVGNEFSENAKSWVKDVNNISSEEQIMDLGDKTINLVKNILLKAKTILWNGTVGVFEFSNFKKGTEVIAESIVNSNAFTVAGGGDTISAIDLLGISDKISYISTGGGAFLDFIGGKKFPVLSLLNNLNDYK